MSEWTPEALAQERHRRTSLEVQGVCPDSGETVAWCWLSDLCDCAYSPPDPCGECGIAVWDLRLHNRLQHWTPG